VQESTFLNSYREGLLLVALAAAAVRAILTHGGGREGGKSAMAAGDGTTIPGTTVSTTGLVMSGRV
jgi:hypothetical protein